MAGFCCSFLFRHPIFLELNLLLGRKFAGQDGAFGIISKLVSRYHQAFVLVLYFVEILLDTFFASKLRT